jgi:hypothetical protein
MKKIGDKIVPLKNCPFSKIVLVIRHKNHLRYGSFVPRKMRKKLGHRGWQRSKIDIYLCKNRYEVR